MYYLLFMLSLILISFSMSANAAKVTCYIQDVLAYEGNVHDIRYTDEVIAFTENKTGKIIFVFGDCMATMEKSDFKGK